MAQAEKPAPLQPAFGRFAMQRIERIRHEKAAELIDSLRFLCFAKRLRTISLI